MEVGEPKTEVRFTIKLTADEYSDLRQTLKALQRRNPDKEFTYADVFKGALDTYRFTVDFFLDGPKKKERQPENASQRHRKIYPQRGRARNKVSSAVAIGKIPAAKELKCVVCGSQAQSYHHHNGYDAGHELDVIAVCNTCHRQIERYIEVIL